MASILSESNFHDCCVTLALWTFVTRLAYLFWGFFVILNHFFRRSRAWWFFQLTLGTLCLHSKHPPCVCTRWSCQHTHGHPTHIRQVRKSAGFMSWSSVLVCFISLFSNSSSILLRYIPEVLLVVGFREDALSSVPDREVHITGSKSWRSELWSKMASVHTFGFLVLLSLLLFKAFIGRV